VTIEGKIDAEPDFSLRRWTGEFSDRETEDRYRQDHAAAACRHHRRTFLIATAFMLIFAVSDLWALGGGTEFLKVLGVRLLTLPLLALGWWGNRPEASVFEFNTATCLFIGFYIILYACIPLLHGNFGPLVLPTFFILVMAAFMVFHLPLLQKTLTVLAACASTLLVFYADGVFLTSRHLIDYAVIFVAVTATGFLAARFINYPLRKSYANATQAWLARREAERATRAKADMLAVLSHEIRTPLNGVIGSVNALSMGGPTTFQTEKIERVKNAARVLNGIFEDILELSRSENAMQEKNETAFSIKELIRDAIALEADTAHAKGLRIAWHVDSEVPSRVRGDRKKILRILLNVIDNAVKYTEAGNVSVDVKKDREAGPSHVTFSVTDTGPGIPEGDIEQIFAPYYQGELARDMPVVSAGFGLHVVRTLTDFLGGQLHARNRLGSGSVFQISLPLLESAEGAAGSKTVDAPRGLNVLVVDDDEANRMVVSDYLRVFGHRALFAKDGAQAVDVLRQSFEPIDLVIMDFSMPRMDGMMVTRRIREFGEDKLAGTPIIGLTAFLSSQVEGEWREAGADIILEKPLEPEDLRHALAAAMTGGKLELRATAPAPGTGQDTSLLDIDLLRRRARQLSPGRFADLLENIRNYLYENADALAKAHGAGDKDSTARLIHKIAGLCANAGLTALSGVLRELNQAAVPPCNPDRQERMLERFSDLLEPTLKALSDAEPLLRQEDEAAGNQKTTSL